IEIMKNSDVIRDISVPKKGMFTGDNDYFLRLWFEVNFGKIGFNFTSTDEAHCSSYKWFPTNKGGPFRRWYGNREFVTAFDKEHYQLIALNKGHRSPEYYFKESISWSKVTSGPFSCRYTEPGFINNDAGMAIYKKHL